MVKNLNALSEARFISGLTQSQLAEKMGVTTPTVSNWEKDPGNMKFDTFFEWYQAMTPRGQAVLDKYLDDKRIFFIT